MRWLFFILLFTFPSEAQMKLQPDARIKKDILDTPSVRLDQQHSRKVAVFKIIEYGIQKCAVEEFDRDLGTLVSISIGSSERRYYSMHQAASVLSGYFSRRKPVSFEFSSIHEKGAAPYATGRLVYIQKGNQESVQVYVSLTKQDSRWVINQFNIY
jgi:hypothetical protein